MRVHLLFNFSRRLITGTGLSSDRLEWLNQNFRALPTGPHPPPVSLVFLLLENAAPHHHWFLGWLELEGDGWRTAPKFPIEGWKNVISPDHFAPSHPFGRIPPPDRPALFALTEKVSRRQNWKTGERMDVIVTCDYNKSEIYPVLNIEDGHELGILEISKEKQSRFWALLFRRDCFLRESDIFFVPSSPPSAPPTPILLLPLTCQRAAIPGRWVPICFLEGGRTSEYLNLGWIQNFLIRENVEKLSNLRTKKVENSKCEENRTGNKQGLLNTMRKIQTVQRREKVSTEYCSDNIKSENKQTL